ALGARGRRARGHVGRGQKAHPRGPALARDPGADAQPYSDARALRARAACRRHGAGARARRGSRPAPPPTPLPTWDMWRKPVQLGLPGIGVANDNATPEDGDDAPATVRDPVPWGDMGRSIARP